VAAVLVCWEKEVRMSATAEQILDKYQTRKSKNAPWHAVMQQVRDLYNTDLAVPLPEMDANEQAAVTNLLKQGIDGTAQRINSTLPDIFYPPVKPGQTRSEADAEICRRANLGWWQRTGMRTVLGRRARHFLGYAAAPVVIRPDSTLRHARWDVRSPLGCYPAPSKWMDSCTPDDAIFTVTKPVAYLKTMFPSEMVRLRVSEKAETLTVLEYLDAEDTVLLAIGSDLDPYQTTYGEPCVELLRTPNRIGMCPVVIPTRTTLDRPAGQFDGLIPMYFKQAKLDALEYIAIEQGVFPRTWLVGRQGESPQIVTMADGRKGEIGVVKGGVIQEENLNPGYKTTQAIDRLAAEQRTEGNVPAEMQGLSGTNIRTGRRGDEVLSNGIDFGIQEAQFAFQEALQEENRRAVAVAKAWFGNEKHSFYVQWRGISQTVEYEPNKVFASDTNVVKYALAGSDLNGQTVRSGQKLGAGIISKKTARRTDPEVEDPDFEDHQIVVETAESAFLQGLAQQMASGQFNPADAAAFVKIIRDDKKDPIEAFLVVQEAAQKRQATSGPPGTPEAPVEPTSPEAMPGVSPGAEAGIPVQAPAAPIMNLQQILRNAGTVRRGLSSPTGAP
jgi:hypothetical protein